MSSCPVADDTVPDLVVLKIHLCLRLSNFYQGVGAVFTDVQFIILTDTAGSGLFSVVYFTLTLRHLCAQHLGQRPISQCGE